jgi:hypothetical protein
MYTIRSINELLEVVNHILETDCAGGGQAYVRWYRGQPNIEWKLRPSSQRASGKGEAFENNIANDFIMNASVAIPRLPGNEDFPKWITIMQHYGLPTRILDWSESPLIALYFAVTQGKEFDDVDASFYVLRPDLLNEHELGYGYIYNIEHKTISDLVFPAFKNYQSNEESADKIGACKPLMNDVRVYAQHSAFTVHNSKRLLEDINVPILEKIRIPSDAKRKLRRELDLCNIKQRFLFPDLSHITDDLKERYGV